MAHSKVLFRLQRDADGYPPADIEGVWAEECHAGLYRIDNVPFFTREATFDDIVITREVAGELFFVRTVQPSHNSLLRVVIFGMQDPTQLRSELTAIGCSTEWSEQHTLIAVNVPVSVDLNRVMDILREGVARDTWDYEEAILRHAT